MRAPALFSIAVFAALQFAAFCTPLLIGAITYPSPELQFEAVQQMLRVV